MKAIIIFIGFVIACGCAGQVKETETPTPQTWEIAMKRLTDNYTKGLLSSLEPVDSQVKLDMLFTSNNWFIAILSKMNDSIGVYVVVSGELDRYKLNSDLVDDFQILRGDTLSSYISLLNNDSLKVLIADDNFWSDSLSYTKWIQERISFRGIQQLVIKELRGN